MISTHLYIHRKKYLISAGIVIALLLIAYAYLRISAALYFNLQTEILITHDPTQAFIQTTDNTTIVVPIRTTISTFHACAVTCDYSFDGNYSLNGQSAKDITYNITIETPQFGAGEQLYTFKSSCKTIPATFCPSSGVATNQTTLIVVNYSLNDQEKNIVAQKADIEKTLLDADTILSQINYARTLRALWPMSNITIPDDTEIIAKERTLLTLWKDQQYVAARNAWLSLNNSLTPTDADAQFVSQISAYNNLQSQITTFFTNNTVRDFAIYAQSYDSDVRTVRQAISRLMTITRESSIADLDRANNIATGAMQYLSQNAQNYSEQRDAAEEQITLAQAKLQFIQTGSNFSFPLSSDLCNATNALRAHDAWAMTSGLQQLTESEVQALTQPVNATYVFVLPDDFCVAQPESIDTQWPDSINITLQQITIPPKPIISAPQLDETAPSCSVGVNHIAVTAGANGTNGTMINATITTLCPPKQPPIIFIHGHSFDASNSPQISMQAFASIQERLADDGFVNGGELSLPQIDAASGGADANSALYPTVIEAPFTVRASYYYITTYGIGDYSFAVQKSERIEDYAIRLKDIIDSVKAESGSQNVTIVAHSMGGLVVREYESLFGTASVNHVITINAPYGGIVGNIASRCSLLGASKECEDMTQNSTFLQRLPPVSGEWDVIASTGCKMDDGMGDGVVLQQNSVLIGATHYYLLNGSCTDVLGTNLHTQMLEQNQLFSLLQELLLKK